MHEPVFTSSSCLKMSSPIPLSQFEPPPNSVDDGGQGAISLLTSSSHLITTPYLHLQMSWCQQQNASPKRKTGDTFEAFVAGDVLTWTHIYTHTRNIHNLRRKRKPTGVKSTFLGRGTLRTKGTHLGAIRFALRSKNKSSSIRINRRFHFSCLQAKLFGTRHGNRVETTFSGKVPRTKGNHFETSRFFNRHSSTVPLFMLARKTLWHVHHPKATHQDID